MKTTGKLLMINRQQDRVASTAAAEQCIEKMSFNWESTQSGMAAPALEASRP
jgi:hypothetical protein